VNKPFTDIDGKALEALITRVSEAKENNLALSPDDCQLLLDALVTLVSMQERSASYITLLAYDKSLPLKLNYLHNQIVP
jgi:hypothetical protein